MFVKFRTYKNPGRKAFEKLTDEQLITSHLNTDTNQVIAILFDRYVHLVFAGCMKYLKDEENAQDCTMEIFESLAEKLGKHEVHNFKAWLFITAKNHCLMALRKQKPVDRLEKIENNREVSVEFEPNLHLNSEVKGEQEMLISYLNDLKPLQKKCVELMYLKGLSYKDIAIETGLKLNHVKSHIQNGKRNLKSMLEKYHGKHE